MNNYLDILVQHYPGHAVTVSGLATDYNNIIWHDAQISKIELDSFGLSVNKEKSQLSIDEKTQALINQGFVFNGHTFSLSDHAQLNWSSLKILSISGLITYPIYVATKNSSEYTITSKEDLNNIYLTSVNQVKTILDSGRELKIQVNQTSSQSELDIMVDNRS